MKQPLVSVAIPAAVSAVRQPGAATLLRDEAALRVWNDYIEGLPIEDLKRLVADSAKPESPAWTDPDFRARMRQLRRTARGRLRSPGVPSLDDLYRLNSLQRRVLKERSLATAVQRAQLAVLKPPTLGRPAKDIDPRDLQNARAFRAQLLPHIRQAKRADAKASVEALQAVLDRFCVTFWSKGQRREIAEQIAALKPVDAAATIAARRYRLPQDRVRRGKVAATQAPRKRPAGRPRKVVTADLSAQTKADRHTERVEEQH